MAAPSDGRSWPANPLPTGHLVTVKHGVYSERIVGPLAEELLDEVAVLVAGTPAEGVAFSAARGSLALKLARLQLVSEFVDTVGPIGKDGKPTAALDLELRLLASVERSLDSLGLTPQSMAKLGVDLARGRSLTLVEELEVGRNARRDSGH